MTHFGLLPHTHIHTEKNEFFIAHLGVVVENKMVKKIERDRKKRENMNLHICTSELFMSSLLAFGQEKVGTENLSSNLAKRNCSCLLR